MKKIILLTSLFFILSFPIFSEKTDVTLDIQKLSNHFKKSDIKSIVGGSIIINKSEDISLSISFFKDDEYKEFKDKLIQDLLKNGCTIFSESKNMITLKDRNILYLFKNELDVNMQFLIISPYKYMEKECSEDIRKIYDSVIKKETFE